MEGAPDLPVAAAGAALRSGRLGAAALCEAHLARIAERDPAIGAFVHVAASAARASARAAEAELRAGRDRGPLHGIPVAVKDVLDVAGWPVRHGSRLHEDRIAPADAPAVARLRAGGAVLLGLTATYDGGIVGPGDDGLYPQPRNPWDPERITGGSSSGSAAAVAAGMVRMALGTDTGGSVRSPAAYCGVVGLKPTFGAVAHAGPALLAPSLDHVGVLARSVPEAAALVDAASGRRTRWDDGVRGLRIGYARAWCDGADAHPAMRRAMDDAMSALSLLGARVALVELPPYALMESVGAILVHAEGLARHRAALRGDGGAMGRMAYRSMSAGAALRPAEVAAARAAVPALRAAVDDLLSAADVLVTPTTLGPAPRFEAFKGGRTVWTPMRTLPFNLTGHPALSIPMGFADGLPLGLQIVARHGAEAVACRVGAAFEAATGHRAGAPTVPWAIAS